MSTEAIAERRKAKNATAADLTTKKHARAPTDLEVRELTEEENRKSYFDIALMLIEEGLKTEDKGRKDWIKGTIMLIEALNDERKRLGDQAFGKWLTDNGYGEDRITRHNRSSFAQYGHCIWTSRVTFSEQTTSPILAARFGERGNPTPVAHTWGNRQMAQMATQRELRRAKPEATTATTPATQESEACKAAGERTGMAVQDTRGWFGNQVDSVNVVVREVTKAVMEEMQGRLSNIRSCARLWSHGCCCDAFTKRRRDMRKV